MNIDITPLTDVLTDGTIELRSPRSDDAELLVLGFDRSARRYLGDEPHPDPWACVVLEGKVAGWIDYDYGREWLEPTEVNVGFLIFPSYRGQGLAARALRLLVDQHLPETGCTRATMLIERDNEPSLRIGTESDFVEEAPVNDERFFTLQIR